MKSSQSCDFKLSFSFTSVGESDFGNAVLNRVMHKPLDSEGCHSLWNCIEISDCIEIYYKQK